ncbi:LysR substrate-binding domain-containing protein [Actinomycetospora corticicola]|uniref:DNA-binding transcriptional LysR family regulator n=1 Tax=Actinomycetospora corticicola TaxID=663602 RepID=A0A7Y9E1T5_9PSEU|nr:LysR family transcriptional regulator [Actinomycetospora corticicola]NYD39581.1 DNA-binding transcriptional LysR family regulator [Actinomycetospora corticicola]
MDVQLHQLEYLVAVVDDGGFTRAAERLRVAQPGVSAQVRKLERELGHELVDRAGQRVRPTAVGAEVVAAARAALAAVAGVRQVVADLDGLLRGTARVGMVTSGPFLDVPGVLADFAAAHPGVTCSLVEASSGRLTAMLREGRLDVALVGAAGGVPDDLVTDPVTEESLVVAVPPDDPLAGARTVVPGDLDGRDVVAPVEGNALREAFDLACAPVAVRVTCSASDPAVLARLAARGLGVAVLPASLSALRSEDLVTVPLDAPDVRARLVLARPRGSVSPAAAAVTDALLAAR